MILEHKTAIVCGSTQGIGWHTAYLLAKKGANIVLIARNEKRLIERVNQLNPTGKHSYMVADFSQPDQLKQQIQLWVSQGNTAHILVNNSGGPTGGPILEASVNQFIDVFQQHLICNHILVQALYKGMIKSQYGRIINIISTSVKQPLENLGVSNTIRGAVASWSKTLANELGVYGITVNNVLPGATNTERLKSLAENKANSSGRTVDELFLDMTKQIPLKRIAEPEEIAQAVAFLASPHASYINGINLPVDGGRLKTL